MDSLRNPFHPGAGAQPPELAGREDVIEEARAAVQRVLLGRAAQSQIFLGLRGTGKTVALNRVMDIADDAGHLTSFVEAPENKRLADLLFPSLQQTLRKLSAQEAARHLANKGLAALRGFASVFKVKFGEVQIGVEADVGVADSGDIEADLPDLFEAIGRAAKAAGKGWTLLIDEIQYLSEPELAAIIVAVHRMAQRNLPVLVFAGGLPQIAKLSGDAKSYAERLFIYPEFGPLAPEAASDAIAKPIRGEEAEIEPAALALIIEQTQGYPYFLQAWGYHAWKAADASPITVADVEVASTMAIKQLDDGFFRVRLDRLTPAEGDYVRAMASLGDGPYAVNDVARALGMTPKALGPRRASIIKKGMIYSPSYGDVDFTVPLFADFLRRTHP